MVGLRRVLLIMLGLLLCSSSAGGMSLRLMSDLDYILTRSESENHDSGDVTKGESNRFQQTYRLDLNKQLFPTLNLNSGVQVEQNRSTVEAATGEDSTIRDRQILPYVDFEWRNPLYNLSGGYRERYAYDKSTEGNIEKNYATSYNLRGEWRPVELPRVEFNYLHTERYDDPLTSDSENDTWLLSSRYDYQDYQFRYSFLRSENVNNLSETEDETNTHSGRVRFNRTFWGGRLSLNAAVRMEYSAIDLAGSGLRDFFVSPAGTPFYNLDDNAIPASDADDFSSGISDNLDLNSNDFINIGLGFGEAVSVSKLQLRINSDDSLENGSTIDNLANWAIYTSDDQENWTLHGLQSIDYLADENLFELTLSPEANAEFIMVVYSRPLTTNQTEPLRVVGIRALISRDLDNGTQLTNQVYQTQFGIGWQANQATRLSYTFDLQERRSSLFDERKTRVNNGLSLTHIFNETFTGTARVSSGHRWDQGALDNSSYTYSARLSARYLETLNQSIIYSGTYELDEADGNSKTSSLILRTNAIMYKGWNISFDQGMTQQSSDADSGRSSYFIRLQNSFVPHESYNIFTEYTIDWNKNSDETVRSDSGRLRLSWVPVDTFSTSGEIRLRRDEDDERVSWRYSASWLPLRDGRLQCVLAYSEDEDEDGYRTRSFSPSITWDLANYAALSLRYSRGDQETSTAINDFETAYLNFRIYYD